jgi:hypothetical protein
MTLSSGNPQRRQETSTELSRRVTKNPLAICRRVAFGRMQRESELIVL